MRTSEQTDKLFAAIAAAQAEMPAVGKSATNPHFKSKFAPLDAVVKAAQPVLAAHSLAVITGCAGKSATGDVAHDGFVLVDVRVVHASGQWIETTQAMKPRSLTPQDVGSCITYASRYGYRMVGLVTDEDDDGNSTSVEKREKTPRKPRKPKPPTDNADMNAAIVRAKEALQWDKAKLEAVWAANPQVALFIEAIETAIQETEQLPM